ncbi:dTDP-4-dehydrorhamnose 3,5-epimerase [Streptomyces sp. NPDC021356]|uniref:dTDP-4-dehydrorhamnose 3,5-epimerase family protein n=1 Tax=Streptomyces sp. NPDC021356 TaxID=3154900 RepID=UPI0033FD8FAE
MRPLKIMGAWEIAPRQHTDARGLFLEWYRSDRLAEEVGRPLRLAQANMSVSGQGVVRGIHVAHVPPGQAKYVTCVRGAVFDVTVDLRVGSPTYGRWDGVRLDDVGRKAVYLSEGLGHGFCALTDNATVCYLTSETYDPAVEQCVHALDSELAVDWPVDAPTLSPRDEAAPSLAEARESGLLSDYAACRALDTALGTAWRAAQ